MDLKSANSKTEFKKVTKDEKEELLSTAVFIKPTMKADVMREKGHQHWMNLTLVAGFLFFLALEVSLAFTQHFIENDEGITASASLAASVAVGIIALCVLFEQLLEGKVLLRQHLPMQQEKSLNALLRNSLSLVGLVFFYPFSCLLEVYQVFTAISCQELWNSLAVDVGIYYKVDGFCHVLQIVFMTLELLFCLQFRRLVFASSASLARRFCVKISVILVLAVNLGLWFSIIIRETAENYGINDDFGNNTTVFQTRKICSELVFGHAELIVRRPLYPFTVEFCLLALEFVSSRFIFSDMFKEEILQERNRNFCNEQTQRSDKNRNIETGIPIAATTNSRFTARDSCSSRSVVRSDQKFLRGTVIFNLEPSLIFVLGIFPNLICITALFLAKHGIFNDSFAKYRPNIDSLLRFFMCYWAVMILLVFAGIACARKFHTSRRSKLKGFEYLVLMSTFGPFLSVLLRIFVTAGYSEVIEITVDPVAILVCEVLNLLQLLLQLPFLFYADSVECSTENRMERSGKTFKAVVLSLALWNITEWFVDSVLLKIDVLGVIFKGSSWLLLDGILRPLVVFFRFNSFLFLLRIYLR